MHMVHAACWTQNLEEAMIFWRDFFGATAGEIYHSTRRVGFRSCFIDLPDGGARIELMSGPWVHEDKAKDRLGWDHIAISAGERADVDSLVERAPSGRQSRSRAAHDGRWVLRSDH